MMVPQCVEMCALDRTWCSATVEVCLSVSQSVCLSVCQSVCLSVCQLICLSMSDYSSCLLTTTPVVVYSALLLQVMMSARCAVSLTLQLAHCALLSMMAPLTCLMAASVREEPARLTGLV